MSESRGLLQDPERMPTRRLRAVGDQDEGSIIKLSYMYYREQATQHIPGIDLILMHNWRDPDQRFAPWTLAL